LNLTCGFCLRSAAEEIKKSANEASRHVVYTLQKHWLITDWTCPALDVDCPTVVPDTVRTSGENQRARGPQVSIRIADEKANAGG
jgi:hypothetical protein